MRKIRCPKCDASIQFDESRYEAGRVLVFQCPECNKQFKIRIPQPKPADVTPTDTMPQDGVTEASDEAEKPAGFLTVLENEFHFRQEIPLLAGENVVGRYVKGNTANAAIRTVDPSVDTTHCVISVKTTAAGVTRLSLRDAPSGTGTFLQGELLGPRESAYLADGDIINIGATTMIVHIN